MLGQVLKLAEAFEGQRIPISEECVYSYRIGWDDGERSLFNHSVGYSEFIGRSIKLAQDPRCTYVVSCDIADFYPRIYHHSLENELQRIEGTPQHPHTDQIMAVISAWSGNVSYGLPIGGNASRVLSEMVLNTIDRNLLMDGIRVCRFVDDYRIFASTKAEAHQAWVTISDLLLRNEGLQLQKTKTLIDPADAFIRRYADTVDTQASDDARRIHHLLRLRIRFDPYSPTADEDYEKLKKEFKSLDLESLIRQSLAKSKIDGQFVARLLRISRFKEPSTRYAIVEALLANLQTLYPILPKVLHFIRFEIDNLNDEQKSHVMSAIRGIFVGNEFTGQVALNQLYALRVLCHDHSIEASRVISQMYSSSTSKAVRRDCILAMARKRESAFLKRVKLNYGSLTAWERSAFLIASYFLTDEGEFWRKANKKSFNEWDQLLKSWVEDRLEDNTAWEIPL